MADELAFIVALIIVACILTLVRFIAHHRVVPIEEITNREMFQRREIPSQDIVGVKNPFTLELASDNKKGGVKFILSTKVPCYVTLYWGVKRDLLDAAISGDENTEGSSFEENHSDDSDAELGDMPSMSAISMEHVLHGSYDDRTTSEFYNSGSNHNIVAEIPIEPETNLQEESMLSNNTISKHSLVITVEMSREDEMGSQTPSEILYQTWKKCMTKALHQTRMNKQFIQHNTTLNPGKMRNALGNLLRQLRWKNFEEAGPLITVAGNGSGSVENLRVALTTAVKLSKSQSGNPVCSTMQCVLTAEGKLYTLKKLFVVESDADLEPQSLRRNSSLSSSNRNDDLSTDPNNACCIVCNSLPVSRAFLPCRHACVCGLCFKRLNFCPMCRGLIQSYFKVQEEPYVDNTLQNLGTGLNGMSIGELLRGVWSAS